MKLGFVGAGAMALCAVQLKNATRDSLPAAHKPGAKAASNRCGKEAMVGYQSALL